MSFSGSFLALDSGTGCPYTYHMNTPRPTTTRLSLALFSLIERLRFALAVVGGAIVLVIGAVLIIGFLVAVSEALTKIEAMLQ